MSTNRPESDAAGTVAADPQLVVDRVLATCGLGKVLGVGAGIGRLIQTFLAQGADAWGLDVATAAVTVATDAAASGRVRRGAITALSYEAESFDVVAAIHCLETLPETGIGAALGELRRVTRRFVYAQVHGPRDRWEVLFFQAGFRKHPLLQTVISAESLENETGPITLIFEKVPAGATGQPLDLLRQSGRHAEAGISRYTLARDYVRPRDAVLDLACGAGYGSAILWDGSEASTVVGLDAHKTAIAYATANFCPLRPTLEFHKNDADDLARFPDESVDLVTFFDALQHLERPERVVKEIRRILRPGGRLLCSLPRQSGSDPAQFHALVGIGFLIEQTFAQYPRRLVEINNAMPEPAAEIEGWLLVAMKDPVGGTKTHYTEIHPTGGLKQELNITAFARDYHNPWLVRSMVTIGQRCRSTPVLRDIATRVLQTAPADSADAGAALCVLGYLLLESQALDPQERERLISRLRAYIGPVENAGGRRRTFNQHVRRLVGRLRAFFGAARTGAHVARWRISNQYVLAKLLLGAGQPEQARAEFWKCAQMDCLVFSPLLATKTVDAAFWTGWLAANQRAVAEARQAWQYGLQEARRVLGGRWDEIIGDPVRPVLFGLREATLVLDAATRCSNGLYALAQLPDRPGYASTQILYSLSHELRRHQTVLEHEKAWGKSLREGNAWLGKQNAELQSWTRQLNDARNWLEGQRSTWMHTAEQREKLTLEQRAWAQRLEQAKNWLDQQVSSWRQVAENREQVIEEQRSWMTSLERGKSWLEQERNTWQRKAEERDQTIQRQQKQIDALQESLRRLEQETAGAPAPAERDETIARLRQEIAALQGKLAKPPPQKHTA
jgi:ubiquinone/menaquinone biosynthesis C-methylase UbiE